MNRYRNRSIITLLAFSILFFSLPGEAVAWTNTSGWLNGDEYSGEPVSLKLVNVPLVDFFRAISELSGLNVLIDPDVQGTITINVEAVPWDQLFEAVLRSHGLMKSISGNLSLIHI